MMIDKHRLECARGYLQLGMGEDALEELGPVQEGPEAETEVLVLQMLACRVAGRWPEMQQAARALMRRAPQEPEFWVLLADATRHAESVRNGLNILEIAEELFPLNSHLLFQLGCYHCQLGEVSEARQYLEKAVALDKTWADHARRDQDLKPLLGERQAGETATG